MNRNADISPSKASTMRNKARVIGCVGNSITCAIVSSTGTTVWGISWTVIVSSITQSRTDNKRLQFLSLSLLNQHRANKNPESDKISNFVQKRQPKGKLCTSKEQGKTLYFFAVDCPYKQQFLIDRRWTHIKWIFTKDLLKLMSHLIDKSRCCMLILDYGTKQRIRVPKIYCNKEQQKEEQFYNPSILNKEHTSKCLNQNLLPIRSHVLLIHQPDMHEQPQSVYSFFPNNVMSTSQSVADDKTACSSCLDGKLIRNFLLDKDQCLW
eukprot:403373064